MYITQETAQLRYWRRDRAGATRPADLGAIIPKRPLLGLMGNDDLLAVYDVYSYLYQSVMCPWLVSLSLSLCSPPRHLSHVGKKQESERKRAVIRFNSVDSETQTKMPLAFETIDAAAASRIFP